MPRYPLHPASGTGIIDAFSKTIRFTRYGCTNRPFYHIVVINTNKGPRDEPIEQLGSYDPMPNQYNEKLVAINFKRLQFWLGRRGVSISYPVEELLGLAGYLPIHPGTYSKAWKNRMKAEQAAKAEEEAKKANAQQAEESN